MITLITDKTEKIIIKGRKLYIYNKNDDIRVSVVIFEEIDRAERFYQIAQDKFNLIQKLKENGENYQKIAMERIYGVKNGR